jgi:hypothetical protein
MATNLDKKSRGRQLTDLTTGPKALVEDASNEQRGEDGEKSHISCLIEAAGRAN